MLCISVTDGFEFLVVPYLMLSTDPSLILSGLVTIIT
jgi:hypothetical protein